jgi:hypothetical protein
MKVRASKRVWIGWQKDERFSTVHRCVASCFELGEASANAQTANAVRGTARGARRTIARVNFSKVFASALMNERQDVRVLEEL